jgi:hypothetical protein
MPLLNRWQNLAVAMNMASGDEKQKIQDKSWLYSVFVFHHMTSKVSC